MAGKSRRRGRHLSRSQRRKLGRVVSTPVVASVAQKSTPAPQAAAPVLAAKTAAKTLAPSVSVTAELKRIGVIGGVVAVLLVAAYFILPLFLD